MQTTTNLSATNGRRAVSLPLVSILMDQTTASSSAQQPTSRKGKASVVSLPPALIMLGLDDRGKPHASWFRSKDAAAAAHAADLMDMSLIEVNGDGLVAIAAKLPQGKLFESGKAFVPFVKRETYDRLAAYLDEDYVAASAARVEAAAAANTGATDYAKSSKGETASRQPEDWSKLTVGDKVLASDGPGDGWYEADVQEVLPEEKFRLRWRDWPELGDFTRGVTDIALLHPKHVDA